MNLKVELLNDILVATFSGDIDHHSSTLIRQGIDREFLSKGGRHIIFDFKNVTFMDSAGIGVIIGRYKNTKYKSGRCFAVNVSESILRIFKLSGLSTIIESADSLDDAVEKIRGQR